MTTIKTLFFDIGGVLVNIHPERTLGLLAEKVGLLPTSLAEVLNGPLHYAFERGELTEEQFFEQFKKTLPSAALLDKADFFYAWLQLLGKPTETMAYAMKLVEEYPVWLVSNTNSYHIRLGPYGLFDGFAGCVYSFEIGCRKPEVEFFEKALELAEAKKETSLLVDDKIENIDAARMLGFQTVHYRSHAECLKAITNMLDI